MNHWFDGFAMLHRFGIADGKVSYANRFLQSKAYRAAEETGEIAYSRVRHRSLPQPLPAGLLAVLPEALRQRQRQPDPARRALHHDDRDADPGRVRRRDAGDRRGRVRGAGDADHRPPPPRSRQRRDAQLRRQGRRPEQLSLLPAAARRRDPEVLGKLPVKEPAYMHSFGLTERWFVLAEFPYVVNPISIPLSGRPYIENYRWKPELGTKFTLIDRTRVRPRARSRPTPGSASTTSTPTRTGTKSWSTSASSTTPRSSRTSTWSGSRRQAGAPSPSCGASGSTPERDCRDRAPGGGAVGPAADQLRPLRRAPLPLHLGRRLRRHAAGSTASSRPTWIANEREMVRDAAATRASRSSSPPRATTAEDEGVLLSVVFDGEAGDSFLLVLDAQDLLGGRARPGAAPHPLRVSRAVRSGLMSAS